MKTIFAPGLTKEIARKFTGNDAARMTGLIETAIWCANGKYGRRFSSRI